MRKTKIGKAMARLEWKNWKLRYKLLVAFIYIGIIPVILIGSFSFQASQKVVLSNTKQYTMEILTQINKNLTAKIDAINSVSLSIVTNQQLRAKLNESDGLRLGKNRMEIEGFLRNIVISTGDIGEIIVIDGKGNKYWTGDGYFAPEAETQASAYADGDSAGGTARWIGLRDNLVQSSLYGRAKVFPSVSAIKDYRIDERLGVLIVNVKTDALAGLFQEVYASQRGNILLLDEDKRLMLSAKPAENEGEFAGALAFDDGDASVAEIGGEQYFVTTQVNERTGWSVVSLIPSQALLQNAEPLKRTILGSTLFILLFSAVFSLLISSDIVKGFRHLLEMMQKVERGNWQVGGRFDRRDEVGQLGNSFNRMVRRLNALVKTTYELKMRENQAELRALQSQIRPHFLYNTLGAINSMLLENDQRETSKVVLALSEMLRYTVGDSGMQLVTVREEMEQVDRYLQIQQFRFEDRLVFELDVDKEVEDVLLPKLLLQPLVENAVVHGIENRLEGGTIRVTGTLRNDCAYLQVEDNGFGISPDVLDKLLQGDNARNERYREGGTGIGLANVDRRLKLIYGEDYGLEIASDPDIRTVVTIRIPAATRGTQT